jgi:D-alanyl-D-alanine carboxypeptidase
MPDNSLSDLEPTLLLPAQQGLYDANQVVAPSTVKITITWRGQAAQNAAEAANLSKACWGSSPHNCCDANGNPASRAFDFAVFNPDGSYVTDGKDLRYEKAAKCWIALGLIWGGTWHHPDEDHIEMVNWKSA